MSNVIPFPPLAERDDLVVVEGPETQFRLVAEGTIIKSILLEGLDNPIRALAKAAHAVEAMPAGRARDLAERELASFRAVIVG